MSAERALPSRQRGNAHGGRIQMSKRLRASIRANNKGRSLRPKTAQMRTSSPSLAPEDEDRISSESPEPNDEQLDHQEAAPAPAKEATDSRTRETLRDPAETPVTKTPDKPSAPPASKSAEKPVKEAVAESTSR